MTALLLFFFVSAPNAPHIKAAESAYQAGKAALLKKQFASSVALLQKAIAIEPTFSEAYQTLIEARTASGDRLEAAAVMTRLLEIEPDASHYRLLLGDILLAEKQWDRGLAQFSFVLRNDPFNAGALLGFASAAKQLGLQDRAAEALSKGHKRYPLDKRFSAP